MIFLLWLWANPYKQQNQMKRLTVRQTNFWNLRHDFHHQQQQPQFEKALLFSHTSAVPQKNYHSQLQKISSISSTFREQLIKKISKFQSRSISMSRTKIVTDSKFSDASLQEILRSQGLNMVVLLASFFSATIRPIQLKHFFTDTRNTLV